ncbi:MAG TPA: hypothetical protein VHE12_10985 [bacterium]|nr:hypothetical protein [bacterium]
MKPKSAMLFAIFLLICVYPLGRDAFAGQTASQDAGVVAGELEKAKAETQKLKDAWDKSRLETTLYEKRVKRATDRFAKAAQGLKDKARVEKEKAEIEFQISLERRKLAYNAWQAAQLRAAAKESLLKALEDDKDCEEIGKRIEGLKAKLAGLTGK